MMGLNRPTMPLAVWTALAALFIGGSTLLTSALAGGLVAIGVLVVLLGASALAGAWLARQLERMRLRALAQLAETADQPDAPFQRGRSRGLRELRRLDDALAALRMRIRLVDEIADRHRRDADSAGVGMFELLSGLVAAEEGTRGQLAAELHDSVAQSLSGARRLLSDGLDADRWVEAGSLVEESEEALRATMARTRPPALRDGDLAAAVSQVRDDLEMRYGLRVTLEWPVVAYPLPLASAVTVYRFFQEALLNVLKHADVEEALASLTIDNGHLSAVVRDNGPGFDLAHQPVAGVGGRHVGLGLLRERARLAGGSVDVMSAPGAGTMLTLRLPVPVPAHGRADAPAMDAEIFESSFVRPLSETGPLARPAV
ncbi:MAG: periplasmic sensor signal transduction histidine kinase [Mycobacterium sp.]|nr:periplasmic sensor signal transduction histidine kinase [Mycobacterium sp.]